MGYRPPNLIIGGEIQLQMTLSDNICTEAVVAASMHFIMCLPNFTAHLYLWADQAKKADTPPFPRTTLTPMAYMA
jgi:hypothetical protein